LAKNLTIANKPAKKAAKTATLIMLIRQKFSPLPRPGARKPKSKVLVVLPEQVGSAGVVIAKTASLSINLLQRFR
jgi:hypothetical protein